MPKFYCVYCGQEFSNVRSLTSASCPKHPLGFCKGKHVLYEGIEKSSYTCKYCGQQFKTIRNMTSANCPKHPEGFCKGHHSPAL